MQDFQMSYKDALGWLNQSEQFGMKLDLENIRRILEVLGNPQNQYPIIHIAGTNGKGSTSAMIASILTEAGFSVGLYTSPHLISPRERIQSRGIPISENAFTSGINRLKEAVNSLNKNSAMTPTYFELMTALALDYFKEEKNNFVVLETGMGGRLDSTNIVNSKIQVITNIDLDHTQYLGKTVEEIALEKAGIIKSGSYVVTGAEEKALGVIKERAREQNATLIELNKDVHFKILDKSLMGQKIEVITTSQKYSIFLKLLGDHQSRNAALAIGVIESANKLGYEINHEAISIGIEKARWPGRFEVLSENPLLVIDAAHNPAGAEVLVQTWKDYLKDEKAHLIFSALKDKDVQGMAKALAPIVEEVALMKVRSQRGCSIEQLKDIWKAFLPLEKIYSSNLQELSTTLERDSKSKNLILVTGSIHFLGEFLEAIKLLRK